MALARQDELNVLKTYFRSMELSQNDIEQRINFAMVLFIAFSNVFDLVALRPDIDRGIVEDYAIAQYMDAVENSALQNEHTFYRERAEKCVNEVLDTLYDNLDNAYNYSSDRKNKISETETNILFNYRDYAKAKADGCTMKKWVSMRDERVRYNHYLADGQNIPITELFEVGNSMMLFPGDVTNGADAEEVINCRCVCKYS